MIILHLGARYLQGEAPALAGGGAAYVVRETGPAEARKPKLLEQVQLAIRTRHYSCRTEKAYVGWIRRFILFHGIPPGWGRRRSQASSLHSRSTAR